MQSQPVSPPNAASPRHRDHHSAPPTSARRLLPQHLVHVALEILDEELQKTAAVPRKACIQQSFDSRFRLKLQSQGIG